MDVSTSDRNSQMYNRIHANLSRKRLRYSSICVAQFTQLGRHLSTDALSRKLARKAAYATVTLFLLIFGEQGYAQQDRQHPLQDAIDRFNAGIHARNEKIAGGVDATIVDNPWQVALVATSIQSNEDAQFCGGSIVGARWVLTAAHCVDAHVTADQVSVLVGTASLTSGGTRVPLLVKGIYLHKEWNYSTHQNDIALLETASDLHGTPIQGWPSDQPEVPGHEVRITGWGALSWQKTPPMSKTLQVASPDPQIVLTDKCKAPDSYGNIITSVMLCIGNYETGTQDTCDRDSGGPATSLDRGQRKLIGITSWGAPKCAMPKKPGIYTRVSQFGPWIRETTKNAVSW